MRSVFSLVVLGLALGGGVWPQSQTTPPAADASAVTGSIVVTGERGPIPADVAVWLTALGDGASADAPAAQNARFRMLQKDKKFIPQALIVPVGSVVDFPNADPFFHNVFSLFDGKRFDLGLYEAGASRSVTFTRPGICFVFCNIHPDMSSVILVVDTPYMALSSADGDFAIPGVPAGRYRLSVWHQRYVPASLDSLPRDVTISETSRALGVIRLVDSGKPLARHKNKYGRDYNPPPAASPIYKK